MSSQTVVGGPDAQLSFARGLIPLDTSLESATRAVSRQTLWLWDVEIAPPTRVVAVRLTLNDTARFNEEATPAAWSAEIFEENAT